MKALIFLFIALNAYAFDWQGHRGARGLYPENTIGAMEEALKWPVTTLELDVVVSKDKKIVVGHEPWMNPEICMLNGKIAEGKLNNLYKMTYEEIQKWDCGSKVHPRFPLQKKVSVGKPLLSRLIEETDKTLKALDRLSVGYNVEIKSTVEEERSGHQPDYKAFTDLVVKELTTHLPAKRFTIQSFDWRVIRYLKEKWPQIAVVALREEAYTPESVMKELGVKPEIFSPDHNLLTKEHVEKFHALGVKVVPWTVNDVPSMRRLKEMGVDGIITDYPNLIPEAEGKKCPEKHNYFQGECVKIPTHALPSDKNPGWVCKPGHQQKRYRCVKIKLPKNAHLLEDGKNWECDAGYVRYRGSCKKQ